MYTDPRTTLAPQPEPFRASRAELAYRELKRRLLLGEFPLVDRLGEERLGNLLDVSRTPVREALVRLHAEGLVERHPEGGYRPAPPDLHNTYELSGVRIALELYAIDLPAAQHRSHDESALRLLLDEWTEMGGGDLPVDPGFVLLDEDFHVRLAHAAGNGALVDTLIAINERIRPVRMHDFLTAERVEATIGQHCGVVGALLADEPALARQRLDAHLHQSLDIVQHRAGAALERMVRSGRSTIEAPRAIVVRGGVRP